MFLDDDLALAAFAFGVGSDVRVILGYLVDNAAIGGIEVDTLGLAGGADFANPIFGLLGNAIGTLALVIGDINIHASNLGLVASEGHGDDVLQSAEIVGFVADKQ